MQKKRITKGFTIIELTVSIVIMGILIVTLQQGYSYIMNRAKNFSTTGALRSVKSSVKTFYDDTGSYPRTFNDLISRPTDPKIAKRWQGPYTDKTEIPDDGWKRPLQYKQNAKGSQHEYELYSWGAKGEDSAPEEWINVWNLE